MWFLRHAVRVCGQAAAAAAAHVDARGVDVTGRQVAPYRTSAMDATRACSPTTVEGEGTPTDAIPAAPAATAPTTAAPRTLPEAPAGGTTDETFEATHVWRVYDEIAPQWHETRRHPWRLCRKWLEERAAGEFCVEIGCGNGRNLKALRDDVTWFGCDMSVPLLQFVAPEGEAFQCCATRLPMRSGCVDSAMSIAVLHHLSTPARRVRALQEMCRVVREGGSLLLYVRSSETRELIHQGAQPIAGRDAEDILIDWRRSPGHALARYHHLFPWSELEGYLAALPVRVISFDREKDNWVVVMEKHTTAAAS